MTRLNALFGISVFSVLVALTGCSSGSSSTGPSSKPTPTLTFAASSASVTSGQSVTLTWQTTNAASVSITATGADGTSRAISTNSQLSGSTKDTPTQDT